MEVPMLTSRPRIVSVAILTLIAFVSFACTNPMSDLPSVGGGASAVEKNVVFQYLSMNPAQPAVGEWIRLAFSDSIDPLSVNAANVRLSRDGTGEPVPLRFEVDGTTLVIRPIDRNYLNPDADLGSAEEWNGVLHTGLKPDASYTISLSPSLRSLSGRSLSGQLAISFVTANLNLGLYWYGPDNEYAKFVPGQENPYYDPSKPVYIFIHGWQGGTTLDDFRQEMPFWHNTKYAPNLNPLRAMLAAGWNVGAYVWGQFADEEEVKDAEAKLWKGANNQKGKDGKPVNMRYKVRNGNFTYYSTAKSLGQLATETIGQAIMGNASGYVRLAGHSLGNQLATIVAKGISDGIAVGLYPQGIAVDRLVLLDPFWSKNGKPYIGNQWTGAVCRSYVKSLIQTRGMVVEQFKSSALGGSVGDENLDMRKMASFSRIWPDFIGIQAQTHQHVYSFIWYHQSFAFKVPAYGGSYLGASASDSEVRQAGNYGKSRNYYYYSQTGMSTCSISDDYLTRGSGVSTW
jgi:hypothetical protein